MPIEVVEYDERWPAQAAIVIHEVSDVLGDSIRGIEHFGSTSVPGLAAKPIIDVMAAADRFEDVEKHVHRLAALGYQLMDTGTWQRIWFVRDGEVRVHLHVVTFAKWQACNERIMRDYLRAHPDDAKRYADLKRTLTDLDSDSYTRAKTSLIQDIVDRARTERGLPLVEVWEE
ncbi:MAG TPA: GrpB family protein [Micromonosporaceae bacterium]